MSEEMSNTVNAVTEEVVAPQEVEVAEVVESESPEVATEPTEEVIEAKPTQSKEDNAKYAEVRRKAEQTAQDKLIAEMYGESHGIKTKAEYDKAMSEQKEKELLTKMKDGEADADTVKQELYKEWQKNDPRIQEYESLKTKDRIDTQLKDLNAELTELGIDNIDSIDDISKLESADKIIELIKRGYDLKDAFVSTNTKSIIEAKAQKIQNETIKKLKANNEVNVGSLADTGDTATLFTEAQVEAMSQAEVNKNYDLVMKSMKTW